MLGRCLTDYCTVRAISVKLEQQRNTHLQCGNACWDGGYAHVAAMAISESVSYI